MATATDELLTKIKELPEGEKLRFVDAILTDLNSRDPEIESADDVLPLLVDIRAKSQEHFVCITLNGANELIEKRVVTIGLLDRSLVHPRDVFADVIADRAAAVIFAHNHPSGDLQPSDDDLKTQNRLSETAKILGIRILDHLIVSRKGHFSFQEAGLIL